MVPARCKLSRDTFVPRSPPCSPEVIPSGVPERYSDLWVL